MFLPRGQEHLLGRSVARQMRLNKIAPLLWTGALPPSVKTNPHPPVLPHGGRIARVWVEVQLRLSRKKTLWERLIILSSTIGAEFITALREMHCDTGSRAPPTRREVDVEKNRVKSVWQPSAHPCATSRGATLLLFHLPPPHRSLDSKERCGGGR